MYDRNLSVGPCGEQKVEVYSILSVCLPVYLSARVVSRTSRCMVTRLSVSPWGEQNVEVYGNLSVYLSVCQPVW